MYIVTALHCDKYRNTFANIFSFFSATDECLLYGFIFLGKEET